MYNRPVVQQTEVIHTKLGADAEIVTWINIPWRPGFRVCYGVQRGREVYCSTLARAMPPLAPRSSLLTRRPADARGMAVELLPRRGDPLSPSVLMTCEDRGDRARAAGRASHDGHRFARMVRPLLRYPHQANFDRRPDK